MCKFWRENIEKICARFSRAHSSHTSTNMVLLKVLGAAPLSPKIKIFGDPNKINQDLFVYSKNLLYFCSVYCVIRAVNDN